MSEHGLPAGSDIAELPKVNVILLGAKHVKQKYKNYDVASSANPASPKDYINNCLIDKPNTITCILTKGFEFAHENVIEKVIAKFQESNWFIKAIYGDAQSDFGLVSYGHKFNRQQHHTADPLFFLNPGAKFLDTEDIYNELLNKIGRAYVVHYYPEILFKHTYV